MLTVSMREWVVLTFIIDYKRRNGYAPTSAEIAAGCGLCSRYAALRTVRRLESAGLVRKLHYRQRAIALASQGPLCNVQVTVMP